MKMKFTMGVLGLFLLTTIQDLFQISLARASGKYNSELSEAHQDYMKALLKNPDLTPEQGRKIHDEKVGPVMKKITDESDDDLKTLRRRASETPTAVSSAGPAFPQSGQSGKSPQSQREPRPEETVDTTHVKPEIEFTPRPRPSK